MTELIFAGDSDASPTVLEVVLARTDRLPHEARNVLEIVAIFPRSVSRAVLSDLLANDVTNSLDTCVDSGFLVTDDAVVSFWHVLSRRAILSAMRPNRTIDLNGKLLDQLEAQGGTTPSRLLYHAREAGNEEAVRLPVFSKTRPMLAISWASHLMRSSTRTERWTFTWHKVIGFVKEIPIALNADVPNAAPKHGTKVDHLRAIHEMSSRKSGAYLGRFKSLVLQGRSIDERNLRKQLCFISFNAMFHIISTARNICC